MSINILKNLSLTCIFNRYYNYSELLYLGGRTERAQFKFSNTAFLLVVQKLTLSLKGFMLKIFIHWKKSFCVSKIRLQNCPKTMQFFSEKFRSSIFLRLLSLRRKFILLQQILMATNFNVNIKNNFRL